MSADIRFDSLKTIVPAVSRETADRLIAFEDLFRKWSKAINLASPSTLADLWNRHILDSAQLFPLAKEATRWLDIGSGGGFPGIVTACFLAERSGGCIDLVESAGKRLPFYVRLPGISMSRHAFTPRASNPCGKKLKHLRWLRRARLHRWAIFSPLLSHG